MKAVPEKFGAASPGKKRDFVSPNVATRGDVRLWCRALGINLKESRA